MLGCPYNLHPEKPWLRRTIRGAIASGVVIASPLIVVGAVTAAVTVLPSVGIYRFVKHIRNRRYARAAAHELVAGQHVLFDINQDEQLDLAAIPAENEEIQRLRGLTRPSSSNNIIMTEDSFPLSIFADMDVENLFVEDERPISDFQTCPTTPAINGRDVHVIINQISTEES
jgi:hypothetical protein